MNLSDFFRQINNMPFLPQVVQELLDLIDDNDSDADPIVKKLSEDPILAASVLRLANSAHYSGARSISNINDAIMVMGLQSLRCLIMASGMASAFQYPEKFDKKVFWQDSMEIAFFSRWLARFSKDVDPDDAFTLGSLHNIGELLIAIEHPRQYKEILKLAGEGKKPRFILEKVVLGVNSADISAGLAKKWKFPERVRLALIEQNNPHTSSELAALLALAKFINQNKDQEWFSQLPTEWLKTACIDVSALELHADELAVVEDLDLVVA